MIHHGQSVVVSCTAAVQTQKNFIFRILSIWFVELPGRWVLQSGGDIGCRLPRYDGAAWWRCAMCAHTATACNSDNTNKCVLTLRQNYISTEILIFHLKLIHLPDRTTVRHNIDSKTLAVIGVEEAASWCPQTMLSVVLHHACISSTGLLKVEKWHRELGQKCHYTTRYAMVMLCIFTHKFNKLPMRWFSRKIVRLFSLWSCFRWQSNGKFWQTVILAKGAKRGPNFQNWGCRVGIIGSLVRHCRGLKLYTPKNFPITPGLLGAISIRSKILPNFGGYSLPVLFTKDHVPMPFVEHPSSVWFLEIRTAKILTTSKRSRIFPIG